MTMESTEQLLIERYKRDLDLLATTSALFNDPVDITTAVNHVLRATGEALGGMSCLFVPDENLKKLVPFAIYSPDPALADHLRRLCDAYPITLVREATGKAFATGEDLLLSDPQGLSAIHPRYVLDLGIHSYISVRIQSRGHMMGMLSVSSMNPNRRFDETDLKLVRAIGDQASNAIVGSRYLEHEVRLRQRAEILLKVAKAMRSELDLPSVLQDAVDVTWQFLQPDFAGVFLLDESHHFTLAASTEIGPNTAAARWPAVSDSFLMRTLQGETPVYVPQFHLETLSADERAFFKTNLPVSASAVPLLHQGAPIGVLVLLWRSPGYAHMEEDHALLVGIAELTGLAIENQRLIQQEATTHSEKILAEEVAKEREALIRQIVHDLRNSTQAISLINEEIQLMAEDNPEIQFGVSAIDRQITFISNFLKEKLSWIKQTQGVPNPTVTDVGPLLERVVRMFEPRWAERSQHMAFTNTPETVELPISEPDLERIVVHFLDNAYKYAPEGAEIKVWCALSDGWATLYVSNDGPGIPIDLQAKIGEAGFRAHPEIEGNGRGLADVKKLVNANGGLFGFTSRPEAGTTFYVTLPTTRWGMA
ncbi:MAG TPA: GAF domain-containing protein [Stenomitos sp.]